MVVETLRGVLPEELGVSSSSGYHYGGPNNKDYGILGSILGSPYFGKLPIMPNPQIRIDGLGSRI